MEATIDRTNIIGLMNTVLKNKGLAEVENEEQILRDINFRSLDFSELALRVEQEVGYELNFDAATLREIQIVKDVVDYFMEVLSHSTGS